MAWWLRVVVALVLVGVGVVWFFQGVGVIKGSFMTGQPVWSVLGAALVVLAAVWLGRAARTKGTR